MSDSGGLTKKEWASLFFVGARQKNEPSKALPRHRYGDPANTVMFESERAEIRKQRALRRAQNNLPK